MKPITTEDLETAFRKLLSYTFYDNGDLSLRRTIAEYSRKLSSSLSSEKNEFKELLKMASGDNFGHVDQLCSQIHLLYYPKKVSAENKESHLITNYSLEPSKIERVLLKVSMPAELLILDVAWLLRYGLQLDKNFDECCYGNRLDLRACNDEIRKGNSLFKKYTSQYQSWWYDGVKIANDNLRKHDNVTIINYDIHNFYHSVDLDFDVLIQHIVDISNEDDVINDPLTKIIQAIYSSYWRLVSKCELNIFPDVEFRHSLPLGLMSAHVFANYYLQTIDTLVQTKFTPLYYGRYVDDCMLVLKTQSQSSDLIESIEEELPDFFIRKDEDLQFSSKDNRLKNLIIQRDKLFLYRFDSEIPQIGIEKYVKEQFERSSEFRFLTSEEENGPFGLEYITLHSSLDLNGAEGQRFEAIDDNKYKISVFLSKLASRISKYPDDKDYQNELCKVTDFFKGDKLIKHFCHWEKILSIFVLANKKQLAFDKEKEIRQEISSLTVDEHVSSNNMSFCIDTLKSTLDFYLTEAMTMALSLNPENEKIDTIYLETFFTRQHYNIYPLQEFSKAYSQYGVKTPISKCKPLKSKLANRWVPYYIHYYDIVSSLAIGYQPKSDTDDLYKDAYRLYCQINNINLSYGIYAFYNDNKEKISGEFNSDLCIDRPDNDKISVALVELQGKTTIKDMIKNYGIIDTEKQKRIERALDKISEIDDVDIFVFPEMSIPIYSLRECCRYSATKEKSFVAGMEYCINKTHRMVYNYIVTCLPVTLFGMNDAIPVIRQKNHLAPFEIEHINKLHYHIPKETDDQYLYHWKDHVFTTYYCYELTNIRDRSHFFGYIDAMYCPVWNQDTYYYNNIAESMARDMHCYFVLSNVSEFGDSRVTYPAKNYNMNRLKVKGGNTDTNPIVVLADNIDIKALRDFQLKDLDEQSQDKDHFKFTAPNFPKSLVKDRSKHFMFPMVGEYDILDFDYDIVLRRVAFNAMSYSIS